MPRNSSPTIKEFKVRAVRVPMTEPHRTASGVITESPLVSDGHCNRHGNYRSQHGVHLHACGTQADC